MPERQRPRRAPSTDHAYDEHRESERYAEHPDDSAYLTAFPVLAMVLRARERSER